MRMRYTWLAVICLAAGAVVLAQAAPAFADFVGPIQVTDAPTSGGHAEVLNANYCGNPAHIIEYPYGPTYCSGGGSNEIWDVRNGASGTSTPIYANYNGNRMCMNVTNNKYSSGTIIQTWNCNNGYTNNDWFTWYCNALVMKGCWIEPTYEPAGANLCFNVAGGFGTGHNIILYSCNLGYANEEFNEN